MGHLIQTLHLIVVAIAFHLLGRAADVVLVMAWLGLIGGLYLLCGGCPLTVWANGRFRSAAKPTFRNLYYWLHSLIGMWAGPLLLVIAVCSVGSGLFSR